PLTCDPQAEQGSLGFTLSSAPGRARPRPRTSGRGRASGTGPKSRHRHHRPPSTRSLNASSFMSQFTWKVPSAEYGQDSRQAPSSQAKGTFICKRSTAADHRRKPEAKVARAAAAAGTSSGLGLQLERHLAVRVDLSVERLVVEGSGSIGLHEHLHV